MNINQNPINSNNLNHSNKSLEGPTAPPIPERKHLPVRPESQSIPSSTKSFSATNTPKESSKSQKQGKAVIGELSKSVSTVIAAVDPCLERVDGLADEYDRVVEKYSPSQEQKEPVYQLIGLLGEEQKAVAGQLMGGLKQDKEILKARKEKLTALIKEVEAQYSEEIKEAESEINTLKKVQKFHEKAIKYTNMGSEYARKLALIDPGLLKEVAGVCRDLGLENSWLKLGIDAYSHSVCSDKINELTAQMSKLESEIPHLTGSELKQAQTKFDAIQEQLTKLQDENSRATEALVKTSIKLTLATSKRVLKVAADPLVRELMNVGSDAVTNIATVSSGLSVVGGLVGLGFNVIETVRTNNKLTILEQNIQSLTEEHKKCQDTTKALLLHAKLDHLDSLSENLRDKLCENVLKSTVGALSSAASIQAVLTTAGIAVGGAATTAFAATGAGAMVLGTGLAAYGIYQKRFDTIYLAKTVDIKPRQVLKQQRLKGLLHTEAVAQKQLDHSHTELQALQLLVSSAYEVKEQLDQEKGPKALKQQSLASQQLLKHLVRLEEMTQLASDSSDTLVKTNSKIQHCKTTLEELTQRQEKAQQELDTIKLTGRFSKYDLYTLRCLQSVFTEALSNGGDSLMEDLQSFLSSHAYRAPRDTLTFHDLLDFITEDKRILKEVL